MAQIPFHPKPPSNKTQKNLTDMPGVPTIIIRDFPILNLHSPINPIIKLHIQISPHLKRILQFQDLLFSPLSRQIFRIRFFRIFRSIQKRSNIVDSININGLRNIKYRNLITNFQRMVVQMVFEVRVICLLRNFQPEFPLFWPNRLLSQGNWFYYKRV